MFRNCFIYLFAKILIAGSITPDVYDMANDEYIEIIDVMKREELAVLNTISTAEGTIEIVIAYTLTGQTAYNKHVPNLFPCRTIG